MPDGNLNIKVTTTAAGGGAQQTAKALEQVAATTKQATTEAKAQGAAVDEKVTPAWGRLREGLKKLGNEVPILGAALNALKNPWTALAFIIGAAVIKVREMIAVQNELAAQGARLSTALDPVVRQTITQRLESAKTAIALKQHAENLQAVADKANSAENALSRVNNEIERQTKEADAQDELETARAIAADPANAPALRLGLQQRQLGRAQTAQDRRATALAEQDRKARQEARIAAGLLPEAQADVQALESEVDQRAKDRELLKPDMGALLKLRSEAELRETNPGKINYASRDPLVQRAMKAMGIDPNANLSTQEIDTLITQAKGQQDFFASQQEFDEERLREARGRVAGLKETIVGGTRFTAEKNEAVATAMSGRRTTAARQEILSVEHKAAMEAAMNNIVNSIVQIMNTGASQIQQNGRREH